MSDSSSKTNDNKDKAGKTNSFDSRYRIRRGVHEEPGEGIHPEMATNSAETAQSNAKNQPTPLSPTDLVKRQYKKFHRESKGLNTYECKSKPEQIWDIMLQHELKISEMHEVSMFIIGLLKTLHENGLDEIVSTSNPSAKDAAAWSRDLERIRMAEVLLKAIQIN